MCQHEEFISCILIKLSVQFCCKHTKKLSKYWRWAVSRSLLTHVYANIIDIKDVDFY